MYGSFKKKTTFRTFFIFLAIVLISSIFRVTNLNLIEFKADEAINLLLSSRISFGHSLPPGGTVSSLGILNPPLFNYLLVPLTFLTHDPRWFSFFIGFINSIAIGFLFLIIKKYYGLTIALITCTLLAFSPWAIIYSRKIWMQDLIIPFFVPLFYSIHKLILEKKTFYWMVYSSFAFFLIQLHQINLFLITLITIFLIIKKTKINLKYIVIGTIIGIIPLLPYVAYEISNECPDCKAIFSINKRLNTERTTQIFTKPFQIIGQGNFNSLLGADMITFKNKFPIIYYLRTFLYIEYALLPLSIFFFIKKFKKLGFLSFSVIILPFAYYINRIEPFMHYFVIAIPLLYLFLAVGFDYLIRKNSFIKSLSVILVAAIITIFITFDTAFLEILKITGSLKGDYGESLIVTRKSMESKLVKYKNLSNYQEILLTGYIPFNSNYGFEPIGKMLYVSDNTTESIELLERKLNENFENPIIQHELFALYTQNPPTPDSIDALSKKIGDNPIYQLFYEEVNQYYLSKNFKKLYKSPEFGYKFYYPEHWIITEGKNIITLKGDGHDIAITRFNTKDDNIFSKIKIGKNNFLTISVKPFDYTYKKPVSAVNELIKSIKGI